MHVEVPKNSFLSYFNHVYTSFGGISRIGRIGDQQIVLLYPCVCLFVRFCMGGMKYGFGVSEGERISTTFCKNVSNLRKWSPLIPAIINVYGMKVV